MGKSFLRSLVSGGVVCLFAVAVASACGSSSAEERAALAGLAADCNINSDCKSPLKCAFRRCHTECETQVDCDANELCVVSDRPYKVCLLPIERGCSSNNDCPEPLFCSVEKDSTCRPACITSKDCITGQVCADGFCAAPPELVDGGLPAPTDGGVDASLGNKCLYNSDCGGNLLCISGLCLPQCKTAKDCPASHTCEQGACIPPGVADGGSDGGSDTGVTVPPCQNGVQDGDETGVDCGGSCGACVGTPCTKPSECASAQCVAKQCAAPNCTDGLQNGTESDVDCGGDCPKCPPQKGCWATQDCTTGSCVAGSCTAPGCSDTLLNGAETDVDCGGAECNPCADGKKCEGNSDCTSANCVGKKCVKAGPTSWVLNTTSEGYSGEVTSDAQNNVVAALNYFYAIDVGNGSVSANNYDVMLAKLTPAGAHLWSRSVGGPGPDYVHGIHTDTQGNVLVGFASTSSGNFGGTTLTCAGSTPYVLAKYKAADGAHLWSRCVGGPGYYQLNDTTVDSAGDVIAVGEFWGSVDFGGTILTQANYTAFVAKYSGVHGGLIWAKAFPASSQSHAKVAATSGTEVFVGGTYYGTMTVGSTVLDPNFSYYEMFALGLDASGNATWARRYGGAFNEEPLDAVGRGGAYYLAGLFGSQADFDGTLLTSKGGEDAFVARIKPSDGSVTLALGFGSSGDDRANGVAVAANGEIAIVGQSSGAINFGGGPLTFYGAPDGFFARFSTTGTHLFSKGFGTVGYDYAYSVGYAGTSLVMTGSYTSGGIVDLGTGVLPTAGSSFLAHLVP